MKNQNIVFTRSIPETSKARLFSSVLALGLVALIMQVSAVSAQAFTVADLNGAYADQGSGFGSEPGPPGASTPSYGVGLWTFDGAGHFTASLVLDALSYHDPSKDQRNLQRECQWYRHHQLGFIWIQRIRAFVIGDGGNQIRYVHTDPTVAQTFGGTMVKQ